MIHIIYLTIIFILILVVCRLAWAFSKTHKYSQSLGKSALTAINERDHAVALLKKHHIKINFK